MSLFSDNFKAAHVAAEAAMGESFTVDGNEYPAISIDPITTTERAAMGGRFAGATTVVYVRSEIYEQAGLKIGKLLTAIVEGESQPLRMIERDKEGDGAVNVYCGPAGVEMPR